MRIFRIQQSEMNHHLAVNCTSRLHARWIAWIFQDLEPSRKSLKPKAGEMCAQYQQDTENLSTTLSWMGTDLWSLCNCWNKYIDKYLTHRNGAYELHWSFHTWCLRLRMHSQASAANFEDWISNFSSWFLWKSANSQSSFDSSLRSLWVFGGDIQINCNGNATRIQQGVGCTIFLAVLWIHLVLSKLVETHFCDPGGSVVEQAREGDIAKFGVGRANPPNNNDASKMGETSLYLRRSLCSKFAETPSWVTRNCTL